MPHQIPERAAEEEAEAIRQQAQTYREQLRLLADALPGLVSYVDTSLRFRFANAAYDEWFGCPHAEVIGKTVQEVLGPEAYDSLRGQVERALAGKETRVEQRVPYRDGERWIRGRYIPHRSASGAVQGIMLLIDDVTHERAAQTEREEAVRARDDFLSLAGHELRTPLTALQLQVLSISRMLAKGEWGEKAAQRAEKAARNVRRLSRLVDELLELSRISAGRLTLDRTPFDLGDAVNQVITQHADEFERANCLLNLEIEPGIVGEWDRTRVEHIVSSLLSNAANYGRGKPVSVSVTRHRETAHIRVRDNGVGIALENQERIFQRFERVPCQQHFGGLGLGLWTSRELAHAHGGSIEVTSRLGEGACFDVSLPLASPTQRDPP